MPAKVLLIDAMSAEVEMIRPDRYLTKPLDIPRFLELLEAATRVP